MPDLVTDLSVFQYGSCVFFNVAQEVLHRAFEN